MRAEDIKDRESLQAWLEALPQETEAEREEARRWAVAIAHRAAMRALPEFWAGCLRDAARELALASLPILRCNLISGVAAVWQTTEIKGASDAATTAYALDTADAAATAAALAADAADAADYAGDAGAAAGYASDAAADFAAAALWEAIRADCAALEQGEALDRHPLWPDENPDAQLWADTSPKILKQGEGWRFWVDWYDNALYGRPQDYDLLTKVALIDPEDWDKGADHVNALIADIRLKHIAETHPLGEDAIEKGADGLWHRTGQSDIDPDILQDAIDSVLDEIRELRGRLQGPHGNMFTALVADLDLLEERIARHPDRPLRLHDLFLRVQGHIARNLASRELPDDDLVRDLSSVLGNAALDMLNACPKTQEVVQKRISTRVSEADPESRADLVRISDAAAHVSDAPLAQEFKEDAQEVADGSIPLSEKTGTLYRLQTRLAKIVSQDGNNLVNALVIVGALKAGVDAYAWIVMTILRFFVGA